MLPIAWEIYAFIKNLRIRNISKLSFKEDRNANAPDSKEERKIFLHLSDITFGLTLFWKWLMTFPGGRYRATTIIFPLLPLALPTPSSVDSCHTICVKWPVPLLNPGLLKS